jgi:hypothetical protein
MTQLVTLPNGDIHSFPDEATPQMISQALGLPSPQANPINPNYPKAADLSNNLNAQDYKDIVAKDNEALQIFPKT